MTKTFSKWMLVPVAVLAAACSRDKAPTDDALKNDLALAAQQNYQAQQFNPAELGQAQQQAYGYAAPQRTYSAPRPVATRRTSTSRSSGTSSGTRTASRPVIVEKHTKRDAAIGAAAGAVIGATTSRDKVKGAVIGAAAGGLLGAVLGNNVDVKRSPPN